MKLFPLLIAICCSMQCAHAATPVASNPPSAPELDLRIQYFSRVLTAEGVTREARYEESMLRRPGHVWVSRVLPDNTPDQHDDEAAAGAKDKKKVLLKQKEAGHKEFNHVLIPRHIFLENGKARIEFVDAREREVISIPPSEYGNVNFDASWDNAYYLLDPKLVKALPVSSKSTTVAGTVWREREVKGIFQRVLWDEQKQLPLIIESGDKAGTFYRRVEVRLQAAGNRELPWQNVKGYAQKEFADFLD